MSTEFKKQDLKTKNGYERFEVISAVQKCIRRSEPEQAMYFVLEMVETDKGACTHVLNRLETIAWEDVGIADPTKVLYAIKALERVKKLRDLQKDFRLPLTNAVLALCFAKKTRYADSFLIVIGRMRKEGWKPAIPDYALDVHTFQGKRLGRGYEHFFSVGAVLKDIKGQVIPPDPYHKEARKRVLEEEANGLYDKKRKPEKAVSDGNPSLFG